MRVICRLLALALLVSFPLIGRAVTIRIQDPDFTYISTTPTSFTFTTCPTGRGAYQDHGSAIVADGCFGGVNGSGSTITSITLTFQNTTALQGSGANDAGSDIFSSSTYTPPANSSDPNEFFTFVFSGSGLAEGQTFVITEDGVDDPSEFPTVTLGYTTATPEPPSLLLLGTSLLCMGLYYRRYLYA